MNQQSVDFADKRLSAEERPRLNKQHVMLLKLFKNGRVVSNREMAEKVCMRYSARIHELRQQGYVFQVWHNNRKTGEVLYKMI
jgi:hypothetical protein